MPWPSPNPNAIQAYREPDRLWKAALQGKLEPRDFLQESLPSHEDAAFVKRLIPRVRDAFGNGFATDSFKRVAGQRAPLLSSPSCLAKPVGMSAHLILVRNYGNVAGVTEILSHSRFLLGDKRYRTDWEGAHLGIFGESTDTLQSLVALSHELGHALVESRKSFVDDLPGKVRSEAMAQILEEQTGNDYLTGNELSEWNDYQRQVDALNFYFFLWECARLGFLDPTLVPGGMEYFGRSLLFFRETLFTGTGYQTIYAAASLRRTDRNFNPPFPGSRYSRHLGL